MQNISPSASIYVLLIPQIYSTLSPSFPSAFLYPLCLSLPQVKHLENENRKLETKLNILKGQEDYDGKINDIVKHVENELEQRIDNLLQDKEKLQAELLKNIEEVEDTKKRSAGRVVVDLIDVFLF